MADAVASGMSKAEASRQFKVSVQTIYNACRSHGVAIQPCPPNTYKGLKKRWAKNNRVGLQAAKYVAKGHTVREAAAKFNLSTNSVYNFCSKENVDLEAVRKKQAAKSNRLHAMGKTIPEIADILNITDNVIRSRLSEVTVSENIRHSILEDAKSGMLLKDIASKHNISPLIIKRLCKAAGIDYGVKRYFGVGNKMKVLAALLRGDAPKAIVANLGLTRQYVSMVKYEAMMAGIKMPVETDVSE